MAKVEVYGFDLDIVAKFLANYYKKNAPYESQTQERPITNERHSNTEQDKLYKTSTKNARETNTMRVNAKGERQWKFQNQK